MFLKPPLLPVEIQAWNSCGVSTRWSSSLSNCCGRNWVLNILNKVTWSQANYGQKNIIHFYYILSGICHNQKVSNVSFQDLYKEEDFTVCAGVRSRSLLWGKKNDIKILALCKVEIMLSWYNPERNLHKTLYINTITSYFADIHLPFVEN